MPRLTHSDPLGEQTPPTWTPSRINTRAGSAHDVVYRGVRTLTPGPCDFHPSRVAAVGDVLLDYIDDHGQFRRRGCCMDCLVDLLPWIADIDAADVIVWFHRPDHPDAAPQPTPEPPAARVLALTGTAVSA